MNILLYNKKGVTILCDLRRSNKIILILCYLPLHKRLPPLFHFAAQTMADFQDYITYILIWLLSTIIGRAFITKYWKTKELRLPPGPLALPIIGHLHLFLFHSKPHLLYQRFSCRYGPLMHFFFGSAPCVVVTSPEMAKEVLQNQDAVFSNRPRRVINEITTYGFSDVVYAPYGAKWRFLRKLFMTELHRERTLFLMKEERNRLLLSLLEKAKTGEAVQVKTELLRLTGDILSRMIMGIRCSGNEDEAIRVKKSLQEIISYAAKFNVADFFWFCKKLDFQRLSKKAKAALDRCDSMLERVIREHEEARKKGAGEAKGEVKDMIDMFLDTIEDENAAMRLTRMNMKALTLVNSLFLLQHPYMINLPLHDIGH